MQITSVTMPDIFASAGAAAAPVIRVEGLRVEMQSGADIVDDVSFGIAPGEVLGLVGESGSGKTTVAMAMLAYARGGARIAAGRILIGDAGGQVDILAAGPRDLRSLRGRMIAYVPQDPASALNPAMRIGEQIAEVVLSHMPGVAREEVAALVRRSMEDVSLPADPAFLARYPHQLSGGQQQRIGIAMAFVMRPKVIVLDEPTTGLDVTSQNHVLGVVRRLCDEFGVAALHVTHDLSVIATLADRIMVMYSGRVVELGPVTDVLRHPRHPYTGALLGGVPQLRLRNVLTSIPGHPARPGHRPGGCFFAPRCKIAGPRCSMVAPSPLWSGPDRGPDYGAAHMALCHKEPDQSQGCPSERPPRPRAAQDSVLKVSGLNVLYHSHHVLRDVGFEVFRGECIAIVGASGSGKSTLSRTLIGLKECQSGRILLDDEPVPAQARARSREMRRRIQYIFQSPFNSLNPRRSVRDTLALAYDMFSKDRAGREAAVTEALGRVGLAVSTLDHFPDELSGGERQRVAIARALMSRPDVLICDEITSALDVSVQAAVLNLLETLRDEEGLTLIFVTHDLALVRNIADRILVLESGNVVEIGPAAQLIDAPAHPFTKTLIADAELADSGSRLRREA